MEKKEAMKILKDFHDKSALFSVRTALDTIIPELKGNEDEDIKKAILELVRQSSEILDKQNQNNMITWLEKQGEKTSTWSEDDERIREELIKHLKDGVEGYMPAGGSEDYARWLSWLEKNGYTKKDVDDAYLKGICDTKHELEKQGEEKPADKAEPKFKVKYAGNEYNVFEIKDINGVTYYGIEDEPNHIDYVKAENCEIISGYAIKENSSPYPTKPAVFSEKKPQRMVSAEAKEALYDKPTDEEMKELLRTEYEKGRADTIAEMEKFIEEDSEEFDIAIEILKDAGQFSSAKWLKSIKDRAIPKPKQEWSEEDEKRLKSCLNILQPKTLLGNVETINTKWLKSLKQRIGG